MNMYVRSPLFTSSLFSSNSNVVRWLYIQYKNEWWNLTVILYHLHFCFNKRILNHSPCFWSLKCSEGKNIDIILTKHPQINLNYQHNWNKYQFLSYVLCCSDSEISEVSMLTSCPDPSWSKLRCQQCKHQHSPGDPSFQSRPLDAQLTKLTSLQLVLICCLVCFKFDFNRWPILTYCTFKGEILMPAFLLVSQSKMWFSVISQSLRSS